MKKRSDPFWLEIKIDLPISLADPAANFLTELTGHGVVLEDSKPDTNDTNMVKIIGYLSPEQSRTELINKLCQYLSDLKALFEEAKFRIETKAFPEENWVCAWHEYFKPFRVTKRLVIKPSWEAYLPKEDEIAIEIDPGMAFGTGHHPSTYLVLQRLEMLFEDFFWPKGLNPSILDIGTGTGILAIAAAKLGARKVVAIDIDPEAVRVARQNVYKNLVNDKIQVSTIGISQLTGLFDIIMANISAYQLKLLAREIFPLLNQKAHLILSGFLKHEVEDLLKIYMPFGLELVYKEIDPEFAEWAMLDLQKY